MAGELTAPRASRILDASGKPFATQVPVRVDRDAPPTTVFLIARYNIGGDPEALESWARRCGRIDNVGMP
jgi:hypothetical protein